MEKLDYLINYLQEERGFIEFDVNKLSEQEKIDTFRMLCNIRKPLPISKEFLEAQNNTLKEINEKRGIIRPESGIEAKNGIYLLKGDISNIECDAIVNAANEGGTGCWTPWHKCIDYGIHSYSGVELRIECDKIMQEIKRIPTSKCIITKAYNLPSKYVIHSVGPRNNFGVDERLKLALANTYLNAIEVAVSNGAKQIAFPCISTGVFRFPKDLACDIAVDTILKYQKEHEGVIEVIFNVWEELDYNLYLDKLKKEGLI